MVCVACKPSNFDLAHGRAVSENPAGVDLRIATIDGRRKFRVTEQVQIEEFYTAKYPGQWHIEVLDGWNQASVADEDYVSDGVSTSIMKLPENVGFVCCDSKHVWLSLDPVRVPYGSSREHSFIRILVPKPGKYQIWVTTYRVFSRDQSMKTFSGLSYATTSANSLKVEVTQ